MSKADRIFVENFENLMKNGFDSAGQKVRPKWEDGTPAHTRKLFGVVNRYNLAEEFPAMTLRPTPLKTAFDELLWIWQRKSNRTKDLASHIWDQWTDENGTIGKAYGYQLAKKYPFPQGEMDQVDNVIWNLKNDPYSRRILTSLYNFEDLHEMNLYPCAYSMTFNVTGNKLNAVLNQRSQDVLAASAFNTCQYSLLVMMLAQVCGFEAGELVHMISDYHVYDRHIDIVKDLVQREQFPAPRVRLNPKVKNFYDFTVDDLIVEDYKANPQVKGIPIAV